MWPVKEHQIDRLFSTALLLTFAGGFADAYTYLNFGFFATAQTGNVILLSLDLANGNFSGLRFKLLPLLAYTVGIFIVKYLDRRLLPMLKQYWRLLVLLIEIVALVWLANMPAYEDPNSLKITVALTMSFVAALQTTSFNRFGESTYSSMMTTGNLTSLNQNFAQYLFTKDKQALKRAFQYGTIVIAFALGAVVGGFTSTRYQQMAILFVVIIVGLVVLRLGVSLLLFRFNLIDYRGINKLLQRKLKAKEKELDD
ncbi:DUF1275 domain-containing protein [Lactobacillus sp. CC-MHH1034]|uniref:YoaK family protein n=1 Tax=Agrilactobacillus fermenti TaxID=2586909 RepID=UPI001E4C6E37|nr:YoaK family protein [Agrilactobacillus fermenti]MCD2255736.1 DUF1275 domain-containing protein [Agrilactobacillus fermenti]